MHLTYSFLPQPHHVHKSVLYVCSRDPKSLVTEPEPHSEGYREFWKTKTNQDIPFTAVRGPYWIVCNTEDPKGASLYPQLGRDLHGTAENLLTLLSQPEDTLRSGW